MTQVVVGKWGRNLAVRLPGEIVKAAALRHGERLQVETHNGVITLRRAVPRVTLEELFRGKNPQEWRTEYADAYDWGPDVGREILGQ